MDIIIWILIVMIVAVLWISTYDCNRISVSEYTFMDKRIKRPLRCVFLSDLHCKMFGSDGALLISKIRDLSPDMILIGGDMITAHPHSSTAKTEKLLEKLSKLSIPVFYGMGNHEYRLKIYPETYGSKYADYAENLDGFGIKITENGSLELPDSGINLISFSPDRKYYKRMKKINMEPGYIEETAGKVKKDLFNILLAHNPAYFETYASYGADLTLSGHVHGGLVRIPVPSFLTGRADGKIVMKGVVSPGVRLFPKYDSGRFDKDGSVMLISRGLGSHTIHLRVFNPAELMVIDLKPQDGV